VNVAQVDGSGVTVATVLKVGTATGATEGTWTTGLVMGGTTGLTVGIGGVVRWMSAVKAWTLSMSEVMSTGGDGGIGATATGTSGATRATGAAGGASVKAETAGRNVLVRQTSTVRVFRRDIVGDKR